MKPVVQRGEFYLTLRGDLDGKAMQREGLHVYMWLIHFAERQKLAQRCKAAIPSLKQKSPTFVSTKIAKITTT